MTNHNYCSKLVGKLFRYNGVLSTIIKNDKGYKRTSCDMFGNPHFGTGVTGTGVDYFEDQEIGTGTNSITIETDIKTVFEKFKELSIEPKWYVVDDFCACLIKEGGNPNKVKDRVAFIEKTPRILINEEWLCGPKGCGGSIEEEGECIYGFYPKSREWCVQEILSERTEVKLNLYELTYKLEQIFQNEDMKVNGFEDWEVLTASVSVIVTKWMNTINHKNMSIMEIHNKYGSSCDIKIIRYLENLANKYNENIKFLIPKDVDYHSKMEDWEMEMFDRFYNENNNK